MPKPSLEFWAHSLADVQSYPKLLSEVSVSIPSALDTLTSPIHHPKAAQVGLHWMGDDLHVQRNIPKRDASLHLLNKDGFSHQWEGITSTMSPSVWPLPPVTAILPALSKC